MGLVSTSVTLDFEIWCLGGNFHSSVGWLVGCCSKEMKGGSSKSKEDQGKEDQLEDEKEQGKEG